MTIEVQRLQRQRNAPVHAGQRWALVLAGGEGRQLQPLTNLDCGTAVPKQFCSLSGGRTLLEDALTRAQDVVGAGRVFTVVTQHQQQWWSKLLDQQPASQVLNQPCNKGTGIALLYAALCIEAVDPERQLVILPADHHIRDEPQLRRGLRHALDQLRRNSRQVVLLGIKPDQVDEALSYILPQGRAETKLAPVSRFVERPDIACAEDLVRNGGLWNTFIMTASVPGLIGLFEASHPQITADLRQALREAGQGGDALAQLFARLPELDFSRDVLEGQPCLKVLRMANCGWSDLGTPRRVAETLSHLPRQSGALQPARFLSLAAYMCGGELRAG